jgi:eukaryotic-like serine/threonine-protein kinase
MPAPTIAPGTRLGNYLVQEPIGSGGMGEVYRALDPRLDREVAVKILHLRSNQDPIALHRFEREARAVAALNHPNLLVLFDIGEADGRHFVVTELLKGQVLRERLERGRLPWIMAARYAADIAAGLEAAHRKGLIHRDLNPRNLFLVDDGPVKVLDFGLVTYENRRQFSRDSPMTTNPGSLVGTSGYISPEQVAGDSVDRRTDIFGLGCCLYEMVTGERAFVTRTLADLVNLRDPVPPTEFVPDLPAELVAIVKRCLRRSRDDRFETARRASSRSRQCPYSWSRSCPFPAVNAST